MTITAKPWVHPGPERSRLHLDLVPAGVVHALAAAESAVLTLDYMSPYLAGAECRGLWQMRSTQIVHTPEDALWITRLMVAPHVAVPVGVAGFHGGPDKTGMVEIGYRVDPDRRRRGYARRSVETLLDVAHRHEDVRTIRAAISPDNVPSSALIRSLGFVETGQQWDEEDGLEIIYETSASDGRSLTVGRGRG